MERTVLYSHSHDSSCRAELNRRADPGHSSSGEGSHGFPMRSEPHEAGPSLYERLGGYDMIAAIIGDLFQRMKEDPRFVRFGMGRSLDSKARTQQLTIEQICAFSGGPCIYLGRDMKTCHRGLGITGKEWLANRELTTQALEKYGIGKQEQEEFLGLFERFREEIVEDRSFPA